MKSCIKVRVSFGGVAGVLKTLRSLEDLAVNSWGGGAPRDNLTELSEGEETRNMEKVTR